MKHGGYALMSTERRCTGLVSAGTRQAFRRSALFLISAALCAGCASSQVTLKKEFAADKY